MGKIVQKMTREQYLERIVKFDKETRTTKNAAKILKTFDTDFWTFVKVVDRETKEVCYALQYCGDFENMYIFNKEGFEYIKYLAKLDRNMLLWEEMDMLKYNFKEMKVGEYYTL